MKRDEDLPMTVPLRSDIHPEPGSGLDVRERVRRSPLTLEPPADDTALARAARAGDLEAFAALVRRHQQRAYAIARAIVLAHEDAEDAVQDAFLHIHRALPRFDSSYPFGAWLARIVANAALDLVRRRRVRATEELPATVALPFRDPGVAAELRERLGSALEALPPRQRAVLVLHDVEGYRHSEIGRMLGLPEGTARSDLHHARATMRTALWDMRRL
jgi:RNA polymerase sigma-70 factor, ECF subfamily